MDDSPESQGAGRIDGADHRGQRSHLCGRGFRFWPAICALACSILLQAGLNLANDYFDTRGNHDLTYRIGPMLGMQTGLIEMILFFVYHGK
jgi:hypothetical protein